ncbi:hypothetical protein JOF41_003405 [Saccharothrix coeruleofusca]|nr:hypothetical protein [Saccharothrix coeruleofusca]MBP2337227.1 hypothetical protein [Saccharothrix coeruleofusca]
MTADDLAPPRAAHPLPPVETGPGTHALIARLVTTGGAWDAGCR